MTRWLWKLTQMRKRLWVRASLIGAIGVLAAILAAVVEPFVPWELPGKIGADAVDSILTIIASSMLAVTTFSLSVMTSAYGAATSSVTPRATRLLMEDRVTQNVLSTFIGSFIFSIVGIIVLKTGAYGDRGRMILFIVTVGVLVLIVISLLRWIDHLTRLGRVGETTGRVEEAAREALEARLATPYLGGRPLTEVPDTAAPVVADDIGYVQHIDMPALSHCCRELDATIYVAVNPGAFVYPHTELAFLEAPAADTAGGDKGEEAETRRADLLADIRHAFSIGGERSFDQDPRFGLAVMSEIGMRALSPAVNDPGTAIDVIGRQVRLLSLWAADTDERDEAEIAHPRVRVPALKIADLFEDAFMLVARDGAGLIEVQLRLQKALLALAHMGDADFRQAAIAQATLALARAEKALTVDADRERLREVFAKAEAAVAARREQLAGEAGPSP